MSESPQDPQGKEGISNRKADHIALCADPTEKVAFKGQGTLFSDVRFVHDALPDLHTDEVDTSLELLGKKLKAPVFISAMTGGTEQAAEINKDLAKLANDLGIGFGLGSQRAMLKRPDMAWTFEVRDVAPSVLLLGNIGIVQAREMSTAQVREMAKKIGADALCVHLNPAMELVQPGGDRDFRGGIDTLKRLHHELGIPVVAKETGCGLSFSVAKRIRQIGIEHCDTSGAGGTSWVGVETLRAKGNDKVLGEEYWDWGIPTAASVVFTSKAGLKAIATGGLKTGLDVARAVALGAQAGGLAAAALRAHQQGGVDGARAFLEQVIMSVKTACLLTGSKNLKELQRGKHFVTGDLKDWIAHGDRAAT
ncbi:MAG: type 2 isopentenyl-diphosphate Delta-isomerase [Deltaproteobacteria bacterium]|nr:type 2 isopentenyl-diphosphate Delta-isomerase [Deltaproteobacteria bacterium]